MSMQEKRQILMKLLAKSPYETISEFWSLLKINPTYELFRSPEIGLVQLQGKMGSTGNRFFLGDATMTRCVVLIEKKHYGYSYMLGRDKKKAELCALIDGMFQITEYEKNIQDNIVEPLKHLDQQRRVQKNKEIESTKVDFFTLVRGEDE